MADRGDTHYRTNTLNLWFAVSSLLLLASAFWMVIDDWNAPWKKYQREFRDIEIERAREELESDQLQAAAEAEENLEAEMARAEESLASQRDEIAAAEAELRELKAVRFTSTEAAKKAKETYNNRRARIEKERVHSGDEDYGAEELVELEYAMNVALKAQEDAEIDVDELESELADMLEVVSLAEDRLKSATKDLELVRNRLATLDPEAPAAKLANVVRDFPGLDFVDPNLKVRKVVLDDLTFELNFTKKQRIDMCMTCHMSIELEGYDDEDLEHPHRSHPRLDLYLGAKSPHPMNQFGCTICHRGSGEALQFRRVDHNVDRERHPEVAARWEEEYHWHKQHHWDYPMLAEEYVEASCVQCHKTSMELIAEEAPQVSEGYRLAERYGCYACHKIEWFPTKRKPGPTLKGIQDKTDTEFMASWIADPKAFRPTTWMPQLFHLENWAPDQVVVRSEYGTGETSREMYGQEWNDTAVAAIVAFLADRAPEQGLATVPVEGDAQRGREAFRLSGCLACHNMEPFEGEDPDTYDLAFEPTGENEHGPNLRGVATKVDRDWLYWWIKDPAAMWSETRMPNLRLTDQEAADIAAYIMEDPDEVFRDVPDGWEPEPSPYTLDVLQEQARWYFSRESRDTIEDRLQGVDPRHPWDEPDALLVAVGEKLVQNYGCYSCHEIEGYENTMPIGTELTTWGSKTVDKLDWGNIPYLKEARDGWTSHERHEYMAYRENWLEQKLHAPRSYDREKVKNPVERLKMPYFGFTDEQVDALTTFVVGLVDDEVQRAKMMPSDAQLARDEGLRAIRQQNCVACHVIEPGSVTFRDEDGVVREVEAELLSMDGFLDAWVHPVPPMDGKQALDDYLAFYEEQLDEEVEELGFRLLAPEPGVGEPGQNFFVDREDLLGVRPPWGGDFVRLATDYYYRGVPRFEAEPEDGGEPYPYEVWGSEDPDAWGLVGDVDGESRDYTVEPYDKVRWTFAPPVLYDEGAKLQKPWFYAFLEDPMTLRPQLRVKMPTFNFPAGHAGAVAEYFAQQAVIDWPARYASELRLALDEEVETVAAGAEIARETVRGIEAGVRAEIEAGLADLMGYGKQRGFEFPSAVDPYHERLVRRSQSYLEEVGAFDTSYLADGERLAREGPQCFQCHFDRGTPPNAEPIAWAPDLARVRERLREDWTRAWLEDPARIYPGTAMPANFQSDPPQYQELMPDSTNDQQIDAIVDWLFNYDRTDVRN